MSRKNQPMTMAEIRKMEVVCRLAAEMLQYSEKLVKPGVSTLEINDAIHERTLSLGCESAPLNYHGFPKSVCTSVNDVICHGVPAADEILMPGDIINIDVTLKKDGFFGDTSATFFVGEVSEKAKKVTAAAKAGMLAGIEQVKAGNRTEDIGFATHKIVTKQGFHTVKSIGGHGIGDEFHQEPQILHYGKPGTGLELKEGMTFTIEPMVNAGRYQTKIKRDGWTVETKDGRLSSQWEHTMLVTADGVEVFTARTDEPFSAG